MRFIKDSAGQYNLFSPFLIFAKNKDMEEENKNEKAPWWLIPGIILFIAAIIYLIVGAVGATIFVGSQLFKSPVGVIILILAVIGAIALFAKR